MRLLHEPAFLSATIGKVYDCALRPEGWEPLMAELAAMLGGRRAHLGVGTAHGRITVVAVMHGIEVDDALHRYALINPILPIGLTWPHDKAFINSRDYGLDAFRATRFYREYVAPRGDLDAICFLATREGDAIGHWFVMTQDDRGPITEEEAAGFELLAPHVRRAVEISNVLGARRLSAETYRAALDQLDAAVLILDGERRPAYANPRAEALLAAGGVLRPRGGRLRGATEEVERALRRAEAGPGGSEALVTGADGEERLLFGVSLDLPRGDPLGQEERSTLLVLRSPREDTRNPIAIAARTFNLTPAQVQVLAFLAQGHGPEEIADILGVAPSTVKTHLRHLFDRTGTARQAELVARALSLASPLRTEPPAERGA